MDTAQSTLIDDIVNQMLLGNFTDVRRMTMARVKSKPTRLALRMAHVAMALPPESAKRYLNFFVD